MSITLLFNSFQKRKVAIGAIQFDALISERHRRESDATKNPVESGARISDHIIHMPEELELVGLITNSPIQLFDFSAPDRVQLAFDALMELRDSKTLVSVVTSLKLYQDMAIIDVDIPRDATTGDAIMVTIAFQKIDKVQNRTVAIQKANLPAENKVPRVKDQAAPAASTGKKEAVAASASDTTKATAIAVKDKSTLFKLFN